MRARPGGAPRALDVRLNLQVRGLGASATVAINERCNQMRAEGRRVFKLGFGQSPFPVPRSVVDELRANAHQRDYLPVRGLAALREAVADFHRRFNHIGCSAEDVLVGPGSKDLMFLLQFVYPGALVVPSPSWVSYAPQARLVGHRIEWLHARLEDGFKLTPDALAADCRQAPARPRILVLNYPSNPTGATYTAAELEALAGVARRYRVLLLADEIYARTHFTDGHASIASHYPEGTIVSSGLSKWCGAGGWRLGTFVFPRELRWLLEAMAAVASETYTTTSAPIQHAAVRAFRGGLRIERYLANCRRILAPLAAWVAGRLRACGARVVEPEGAFYLFPDLSPLAPALAARGIRNSRELCDRLLDETGVAILPGAEFGRLPAELTSRLALVDFDGARALAAVEALPRDAVVDEAFLRAYCAPTLEAVKRLVGWLGRPGTGRRPKPAYNRARAGRATGTQPRR